MEMLKMVSHTTLGEIIHEYGGLIQTGPFGSQLHQYDYTESGTPVVMPKDIQDGRVDLSSIAHISDNKVQELRRHILPHKAIVMPRRGDVSKRAYIQEEQAGILCGTGCIQVVAPESVLKPQYLYYYLEQRKATEWLERNAVGTTMLNLSSKIIRDIPIVLIPTDEQEYVVEILSAYDDLIENNRRRIQLLEQSARLLYKEWFVHLRFPGHEHVQVVDGIPEGWGRGTVDDLTSFLSRGITPKYDEEALGIVINQKCIRDGLLNLALARHQGKNVPKDKLVRLGDVLINSTGKGTLGRVAQIIKETENCTVDSHVTIVRPKEELYINYLGILLLYMESQIASMGRGATNQTELSRAAIANIPILIPPEYLVRELSDFAKDKSRQVSILISQNIRLTKARDLLLPRLMNGTITV